MQARDLAADAVDHVRAQLAALVGDDAGPELDDHQTRHLPEWCPRVELEDSPCKLHVIAGLEAGLLERADHAHLAQPLLDVAERLLVLDVVPREQPLDRRPDHAQDAVRARARRGSPSSSAGR